MRMCVCMCVCGGGELTHKENQHKKQIRYPKIKDFK